MMGHRMNYIGTSGVFVNKVIEFEGALSGKQPCKCIKMHRQFSPSTLKMRTEFVLETSVHFNTFTRLLTRKAPSNLVAVKASSYKVIELFVKYLIFPDELRNC